MGDRANVYVKNDSDKGVYLYTHWGGYELPLVVKQALAKRWRWNDESYLTRIIFDAMTEGRQGNETGFGIATYRPDNEHLIIALDCSESKIAFCQPDSEAAVQGEHTWTFEEFVALSDEEIGKAWGNA
jgi:hypothetical protein